MTEDFRVLIVDDDFHVARLHYAYVEATPGFIALEPVGGGEAALGTAWMCYGISTWTRWC